MDKERLIGCTRLRLISHIPEKCELSIGGGGVYTSLCRPRNFPSSDFSFYLENSAGWKGKRDGPIAKRSLKI